jgi:hypothetical protein
MHARLYGGMEESGCAGPCWCCEAAGVQCEVGRRAQEINKAAEQEGLLDDHAAATIVRMQESERERVFQP